MNRFALAPIALSLLALAACNQETPKASPSGSPSASASPTEATPTPGAAAKRLPLPNCDDLAKQGDAAYKDCRLFDEKSGLGFEARFTKDSAPDQTGHTVNIQVVQPGDATLQTLTEKVEGTISVMELQDLDGDGHAEVLVPLMTGNVNTEYAVWHMPAGANQFLRVGTVSGYGVGRKDDYVVVNARSAANIQDLLYYTLKNGELKLVGAAEFTASGDPNKPTVKCEVLDGKPDDPKGGLATAGLTMKTAAAKWCSEKAKKDAF
jgi:hypothetical protein